MTYKDSLSDGVHIEWRRHYAFIDDDGESWDFAELVNSAVPHAYNDPWREDKENTTEADEDAEARAIWDALPEQNRAWFEVYRVLPYENILDIDEKGDECFGDPHIYTTPFHPKNGPFRPYNRISLEVPNIWGGRRARADETKRIRKFPRQAKSAKKAKPS